MEREIPVMALRLEHGEDWTYFPESGIYAIATRLDLARLQRAVAEMTVHAQMLQVAIPLQAVPA